MKFSFYFEPRDLWVGIHWKDSSNCSDIRRIKLYICLVPCLPIVVEFPSQALDGLITFKENPSTRLKIFMFLIGAKKHWGNSYSIKQDFDRLLKFLSNCQVKYDYADSEDIP